MEHDEIGRELGTKVHEYPEAALYYSALYGFAEIDASSPASR
jgi:hypothetical protein